MKKIILVLVMMLALLATNKADQIEYNRGIISIQTFYDALTPYGDWVNTNEYGYVWRPFFDNPQGFRPYSSGGTWANTEYGWTWVSDYPWGWATFHYGRWYFDDYLGWMWIPGYEWAPAWVSWGSYNDYWGWAPLGPEINVSINFNWRAPDFWWTFVPCRHFYSNNWRNNIYDRPVFVQNITYITNIYDGRDNRRRNSSWFYGPRVSDVERRSQTRVRQMRIVDNDRPENLRMSNDQVNVYRPEVVQRRGEYRPSESRNAYEIRSEQRIRQEARTNDPGMNRSRSQRNSTWSGEPNGRVNNRSSRGATLDQKGNKPADGRNSTDRQMPQGRNSSVNDNQDRNRVENRQLEPRKEVTRPENKTDRQPVNEPGNLQRNQSGSENARENQSVSKESGNQGNAVRQSTEISGERRQEPRKVAPVRNSEQRQGNTKKTNSDNQQKRTRSTEKSRSSVKEADNNPRR